MCVLGVMYYVTGTELLILCVWVDPDKPGVLNGFKISLFFKSSSNSQCDFLSEKKKKSDCRYGINLEPVGHKFNNHNKTNTRCNITSFRGNYHRTGNENDSCTRNLHENTQDLNYNYWLSIRNFHCICCKQPSTYYLLLCQEESFMWTIEKV